MFRGDATRNGAAVGGAPLFSMCWRVPTLIDVEHPADVDEAPAPVAASLPGARRGVLSGLHPLVVDDVVLMRDLHTLLAIDFQHRETAVVRAGRRSRGGRQPRHAGQRGRGGLAANASTWCRCSPSGSGRTPPTARSAATAAMSSASRTWPWAAATRNGNNGGMWYRRSLGRMRCGCERGQSRALQSPGGHDIHSGKLVWHIGGARRRRFPLRQAGTIFLGPPLPLRGQLYVLAEVNDEIRLLALDARNRQHPLVAATGGGRSATSFPTPCGGRRDCRLPMPTAS